MINATIPTLLTAFILIAQIVLYLVAGELEEQVHLLAILGLSAFASGIFFYAQRKTIAGSSVFTISMLFILSYIVVGLQVPVLDLLGYHVLPRYRNYMWSSSDVGIRSVALVCLGLVSFYLGWLVWSPRARSISPQFISPARSTLAFGILMLVTIALYLLFLRSAGSLIRGEYTPSDASSAASYFYKLFKISLTATIIYRVWLIIRRAGSELRLASYLRGLGWPLLLLLLFHCTLLLWVGDRGPLIYFVLLALGPYLLRYFRRSQGWLVLILVVASMLLTILGDVRQARFSGDPYSQRLLASISAEGKLLGEHRFYGDRVPLASTMELASSFKTITHSVAYVPAFHSYMYGYFTVTNFVAVIPGLSGALSSMIFSKNMMYQGSANFVTHVIQGDSPQYGEGTSVVSELYLDFGAGGVIAGLFIFGLAVRAMEVELVVGGNRVSLAWVASMAFFANSVYLARSSLGSEFSNIVFAYLLILISLSVAKLGVRRLPQRSDGV